MLILTRRPLSSRHSSLKSQIIINPGTEHEIIITVVSSVNDKDIRIGIDAPKGDRIVRGEIAHITDQKAF
jgi:sRNA-binding carbon storage regulator CsrA